MTNNSIEVQGKTFFLDSSTTILLKGHAVNKTELKTGVKVTAYGYFSNNQITATTVIIEETKITTDSLINVQGIITNIKDSTVTVAGFVFHILPDTKIRIELIGEVRLPMLKIGQYAVISGYLRDSLYFAVSIKEKVKITKELEVIGIITAITDSTITVDSLTFTITGETHFVLEDSGNVAQSFLELGQKVEIKGYTADSTNIAVTIEIQKPETTDTLEFDFRGEITAIHGDTIKVNNIPVIIDANSVIVIQGKGKGDLSDIKVGNRVKIKGYTRASVNFAHIIKVNLDGFDLHLKGKITVISDEVITINHTEFRLNSETKFYDQGKELKFINLKTGMFIKIIAGYFDNNIVIYQVILLHDGNFDKDEDKEEIGEIRHDAIVVGDEAYIVDVNTKVFDDRGMIISYYDLNVKMTVVVIQDVRSNNLYATSIMIVNTPASVKESDNSEINLKVTPNIILDAANISFKINTPTNAVIIVYDQLGNLMLNVYNGYLTGGAYNFPINEANGLAAGMYFLRFRTENKVYSLPFIKLN